MTLKELSELIGKSENTIKTQFKRTAAQLLEKKGIILTKQGRGDKVEYFVEYTDDRRADNLYKEAKTDIILSQSSISYPAFEFLIFLTLATIPMLVFRGSYGEFLKYVQIREREDNIEKLKRVLEELSNKDIVMYNVDKTNNNYFVASIYRKVEEETKIGIEMVRECKRLQEEYNKKEWISLLKTWIGIKILHENQPYTQRELAELTGQSEYTVREASKILEKSNIFKTSKVFVKGTWICLGIN